MDVALIGKNTLRIKGKNASFVVNPDTSTGKTETDAIVLLGELSDQSFQKIVGSRITIKGVGEYEISGVKISTTKAGGNLVARGDIDGVKVLIGSGQSIERIHDSAPECDIAVINTEAPFNQAVLTSLEPKVLLLYGENKEDVAKSLGKGEAEGTSKFSTTSEKLPEEMQVYLLG